MTRASTTPRPDVYARITANIIAAIEADPGRFQTPWRHDGAAVTRPVNIASGNAYRGVNVVSLWASAQANGYHGGVWGTYQQWQVKGAQVRKGEASSLAVFWKDLSTDQADEADEDRPRLVVRAFSLFNADQVEGYCAPPRRILPESERLVLAEAFISALGVPVRFGSDAAYYDVAGDQIVMPNFAAFRDAHGFYATHLHECAHATGAKHRLDRDFTGKWSKDALAMEEMTAELASAFLLADLGIAHEPRPDHAAYVASWLRVLKDDPRAIFTAAAKAQAAADWMHARQVRD